METSVRLKYLLICVGCMINGAVSQIRGGQIERDLGTFLGYFEPLAHDVGGEVWGLDEEWLRVRGFTYDGRGPDAFFWVGVKGDQASPDGYIIPYHSGATVEKEMILPGFRGEDVLFRIPPELGIKVSDLRWISIWCRRFTVDFGSLRVPPRLVLPKAEKLAELSRITHNVRSGNVTLLDAKTLYIPNFHYDGKAPDAFFWVGLGKQPDKTGHKIPNEKRSLEPLGHYDGVDIELVLPDNLTLYDVEYLSIWCRAYNLDFGHVLIPPANQIYLPPALGQTQVKSGLRPVETSEKDRYDITTEVSIEDHISTTISAFITDAVDMHENATMIPVTSDDPTEIYHFVTEHAEAVDEVAPQTTEVADEVTPYEEFIPTEMTVVPSTEHVTFDELNGTEDSLTVTELSYSNTTNISISSSNDSGEVLGDESFSTVSYSDSVTLSPSDNDTDMVETTSITMETQPMPAIDGTDSNHTDEHFNEIHTSNDHAIHVVHHEMEHESDVEIDADSENEINHRRNKALDLADESGVEMTTINSYLPTEDSDSTVNKENKNFYNVLNLPEGGDELDHQNISVHEHDHGHEHISDHDHHDGMDHDHDHHDGMDHDHDDHEAPTSPVKSSDGHGKMDSSATNANVNKLTVIIGTTLCLFVKSILQ